MAGLPLTADAEAVRPVSIQALKACTFARVLHACQADLTIAVGLPNNSTNPSKGVEAIDLLCCKCRMLVKLMLNRSSWVLMVSIFATLRACRETLQLYTDNTQRDASRGLPVI